MRKTLMVCFLVMATMFAQQIPQTPPAEPGGTGRGRAPSPPPPKPVSPLLQLLKDLLTEKKRSEDVGDVGGVRAAIKLYCPELPDTARGCGKETSTPTSPTSGDVIKLRSYARFEPGTRTDSIVISWPVEDPESVIGVKLTVAFPPTVDREPPWEWNGYAKYADGHADIPFTQLAGHEWSTAEVLVEVSPPRNPGQAAVFLPALVEVPKLPSRRPLQEKLGSQVRAVTASASSRFLLREESLREESPTGRGRQVFLILPNQ